MADAPDRQFVLISDDDGHWYVVPADKQEEAAAYFDLLEQYLDGVDDGLEPPAEPDWLDEVGGAPCLVKFTGYTIE